MLPFFPDKPFSKSSDAHRRIHGYIRLVAQPVQSLKRAVIFVHRWLGIALCLLFVLWFPSGIGMMYWTFPDVSAADRLERAAVLDPGTIRLSPEDAWRAIGQAEPAPPVRLNSFA